MQYDVVVIGAGPGGYEAALELARHGKKTLIVEKTKSRLGGTCLNEGCIPAKHYLELAEYYSRMDYFREAGLEIAATGFDLAALKAKTEALVLEIRTGISWLLEHTGVEKRFGPASFVDEHTIDVDGEKIGFVHCIIATGSAVKEMPQLPLDGRFVLSSKEVLELQQLPKSVVIVGGGAIGCEFATFFNALGCEVTLIGRRPYLLPQEDKDVSKALAREFKKRGVRLLLASSVERIERTGDGVEVRTEGEEKERVHAEVVLLATGRVPYTDGLSVERAGVLLDEKGFVHTDASLRTSQPHIFAVGDCIDTLPYAHVAHAEARVAAHNIITGESSVNEQLAPSVVFSKPQIASCGLQESQAEASGREVEVKKVYFKANPKAKILGDDSGFAKIVVDSQSGVILGATVIGVLAGEIIHELSLAVNMKMTAAQLRKMVRAHPTVAEIVSAL